MVLARWQATGTDEAGNILPTAAIEVREELPGQPLVPLFSDRAGTLTIGNPFLAGADGFAVFHAASGAYRIKASKGAFERVWRYVGIGTLQEADFEDLPPPVIPLATTAAAGLVELATVAELRSAPTRDKALVAEHIEAASAAVALADAATVALNWDAGINFTLTVTASRVIGNPTNGQPGTWRTVLAPLIHRDVDTGWRV